MLHLAAAQQKLADQDGEEEDFKGSIVSPASFAVFLLGIQCLRLKSPQEHSIALLHLLSA